MKCLLLILMCLPLQAVADEDKKYCVNGVWYNRLLPNLPNSVEVIAGDEKYSGSVEIPQSIWITDGDISRKFEVIRIGDKAFKDCKDLTKVSGGAALQKIGKEAFKNCVGLRGYASINFIHGEQLSSIDESAFENCTGITDVYFSHDNSYYTIGKNAFRGCTSLKRVYINHAKKLGAGAFYGCSELEYIEFSYLNDGTSDIDTIGAEAFAYCTKARITLLPENFKVIGERAFLGNKITEITLPHSLETIESNAFQDCPIKSVRCYATRPPAINATAFDNPQNIRLSVPHAERYKQADTWKDFGTIEETPLPSNLRFTPYPPTIEYSNGQIHLSSMDDQVYFHTVITCQDDGVYNEETVNLSATYHIWAYAWYRTEDFFEESTKMHAYLAWIDLESTEEEIRTSISENYRKEPVEVKGLPILIEKRADMVIIKGGTIGTPVEIYNISGQKVASGEITGPVTNIRALEGSLFVVKIGNYSIKMF